MALVTSDVSVMPFQTQSMVLLSSSRTLLSQTISTNSTLTPRESAKALARSASKPIHSPDSFW